MPAKVSVKDARAIASRTGFQPLQLTNNHFILPLNDDLRRFAVVYRDDWFKKVRLREDEWTAAFVRVRRHALTKKLCPDDYSEELQDTEPRPPFGELLVRQYTERLSQASPVPGVDRSSIARRQVITLENIVLHPSFDSPQTREGYNGYRIRTTRDHDDLFFEWRTLVDLAILWLRDEEIVKRFPWAADPEGLTPRERKAKPLRSQPPPAAKPEPEQDEVTRRDHNIVHFGRGFLQAVEPLLGDDRRRVFVQTVTPAAEHLVAEALKASGEPVSLPDPWFLLKEHRRLEQEAKRVAAESERLAAESARLEQLRADLDAKQTELEALRAAAAGEIKALFDNTERSLLELRSRVHAEAAELDSAKDQLRALLK